MALFNYFNDLSLMSVSTTSYGNENKEPLRALWIESPTIHGDIGVSPLNAIEGVFTGLVRCNTLQSMYIMLQHNIIQILAHINMVNSNCMDNLKDAIKYLCNSMEEFNINADTKEKYLIMVKESFTKSELHAYIKTERILWAFDTPCREEWSKDNPLNKLFNMFLIDDKNSNPTSPRDSISPTTTKNSIPTQDTNPKLDQDHSQDQEKLMGVDSSVKEKLESIYKNHSTIMGEKSDRWADMDDSDEEVAPSEWKVVNDKPMSYINSTVITFSEPTNIVLTTVIKWNADDIYISYNNMQASCKHIRSNELCTPTHMVKEENIEHGLIASILLNATAIMSNDLFFDSNDKVTEYDLKQLCDTEDLEGYKSMSIIFYMLNNKLHMSYMTDTEIKTCNLHAPINKCLVVSNKMYDAQYTNNKSNIVLTLPYCVLVYDYYGERKFNPYNDIKTVMDIIKQNKNEDGKAYSYVRKFMDISIHRIYYLLEQL